MSKRFWRKKGKTDTELVARAEHAVWRTQDMVFEKRWNIPRWKESDGTWAGRI